MDEHRGAGPGPGLTAFGGNPPPTHLLEGWRHLLELSEENQKAFGVLFESVLQSPGELDHQERIGRFSQELGLDEAQVLSALQACDTLFHQAAAFDMGREQFVQDLALLSGGQPHGLDPVLARYDVLKAAIRGGILKDTLADHGKVLLGLDWRIDKVLTSDRGVDLDGTVMLLTLRYREGDRLDRITLQLTPEALADLKRFAARIQG